MQQETLQKLINSFLIVSNPIKARQIVKDFIHREEARDFVLRRAL